jgi:hypothetical protein
VYISEHALAIIDTVTNAVAAVGTVGAVVVALFLARRDSRVRIRVINGIYNLASVGQTIGSAPRVIRVSATNIGFRAARVEGVFWQLGRWRWRRRFVTLVPSAFPGSTPTPAKLEYGDEALFLFPLASFPKDAQQLMHDLQAARFRRLAVGRLRVGVYTSAGHEYTAPIDFTLRKWLREQLSK